MTKKFVKIIQIPFIFMSRVRFLEVFFLLSERIDHVYCAPARTILSVFNLKNDTDKNGEDHAQLVRG